MIPQSSGRYHQQRASSTFTRPTTHNIFSQPSTSPSSSFRSPQTPWLTSRRHRPSPGSTRRSRTGMHHTNITNITNTQHTSHLIPHLPDPRAQDDTPAPTRPPNPKPSENENENENDAQSGTRT
ncbi:hypothetical protein BV22DRAFT_490008 [Leucogyrophana mollusca]|uniref:Uncharacterized protein n=1 Tax=Leucogyrophana mollusca TaxID=85980 RepID=A0ACB8BIQ5_9AGAM|nr:hypothetical protein BV22DRAFT_490008 [Leucogyrophana mollusca]